MIGEKRGIVIILLLMLFIVGCENGKLPEQLIPEIEQQVVNNTVGQAAEITAKNQQLLSNNNTTQTKEQHQSDPKNQQWTDTKMSGRFRCWSYNVQGAGKSCTSPPLLLNADGTYSMSSEQGTYTVEGDTIILSESKIRGPGTILEDGYQIRFEYDYKGWHHTMTYLKADWEVSPQEATKEGSNYVEVSLDIIFPEGTGVSGINSAALVDDGETVGETVAYESAPNTVRALFRKLATKPGIPTGKVYTVQVSSGFGYWDAGKIDLRNVTEDVELDVYATIEETVSEDDQNTETPPAGAPETPASEEPTAPPSDAPPCDLNIPKYSQPGCV